MLRFSDCKKEDLVLRIELPSAYQEVISRNKEFSFFQENLKESSAIELIVDKILQ